VFCLRIVPGLRARVGVHPRLVGPLMRFGGWMTVTNIVTPLMTYGDRFMLGALLPVAAVAYYVTPYELITKLWLIPGSIAGVVFPAVAATLAQDRGRATGILFGAVRANVAALFPAVLILAAFAPEGLHLWLGAEFAREGASVLRWLAAGMLVNCVGQMAGVAVQAAGRPDLTAKLHMVELPVYMGVLYYAAAWYGVQGAAAAWSIRMVVDTALLLALARRFLPGSGRMLRWTAVALGVTGAALAGVALPHSLAVRAAVCAVALVALCPLGWRYALLPAERTRLAAALRTRRPGAIFP
jgi:O-antigen/teichoic acid export membrane protein